jgi:hypothetical protein
MTISEQLGFSILSAPIATVDRRALSQAWYSALYGDKAPPVAAAAVPAKSEGKSAHPRCTSVAATARHSSATCAQAPLQARRVPLSIRGGEIERRSPRSSLARKIERAFLRPAAAPQKATFAVGGKHGRVQVMLRQQGKQLKLVAICTAKAKPYVANALAHARYALALRGVDLQAEMRETAAC